MIGGRVSGGSLRYFREGSVHLYAGFMVGLLAAIGVLHIIQKLLVIH